MEHELRCVSDSGTTWCRNPGETPGEAEGETPGEAEGDRTELDADCCRSLRLLLCAVPDDQCR